MKKALLILDLDETLIRGEKAPLARPPDFVIRDKYYVYIRPGAEEFLREMAKVYRIAIWSSSTARYVGEVLEGLLPEGFETEFAWSREECVERLDSEGDLRHYVKDLERVESLGFCLARTLMVDNTARKVRKHLDNHVPITSYFAEAKDVTLSLAAKYLKSIADAPDFRNLDKFNWLPIPK